MLSHSAVLRLFRLIGQFILVLARYDPFGVDAPLNFDIINQSINPCCIVFFVVSLSFTGHFLKYFKTRNKIELFILFIFNINFRFQIFWTCPQIALPVM